MRRIMLLLLLATAIVHAHASYADSPTCTAARVVHVVDGDTVDALIASGTYRVRYIGVNTPEVGQPCYSEATAQNSALVLDQQVCLQKDVSETDRYGRLLRYVYVGDLFVNAELVRLGYASAMTVPPDVHQADLFVRLEREARIAGRGCWASANSITLWLPVVMRPAATPTPTRTPTRTVVPTPTKTPTVQPSPAVVRIAPWCSQFDAPGDDNNNLNEEYVCLENQGASSANMTGWHIRDEYGWDYIFPSFTLAAGARVRLHTGVGTNTATDVYWNRSGSAVWNNGGDVVNLYDNTLTLVDRYSY